MCESDILAKFFCISSLGAFTLVVEGREEGYFLPVKKFECGSDDLTGAWCR